jgi:hypothetical protein
MITKMEIKMVRQALAKSLIAKAVRTLRAASSFLLLTKLEAQNIRFTHEVNHQKAVLTSANNRDLLAARKHKTAITINSSLS